MKFHKALKKLRNGKARTISSNYVGMYKQTLETLIKSLCEMDEVEARKKLFYNMLFSDDWLVDSKDDNGNAL